MRTWVINCNVCCRWSSVPTLEIQAICREAGACLTCMKNEYYMLKVRIATLEMQMENLAKRGATLPEEQRPILRQVYTRKARKLMAAQRQLKDLASVEVPVCE